MTEHTLTDDGRVVDRLIRVEVSQIRVGEGDATVLINRFDDGWFVAPLDDVHSGRLVLFPPDGDAADEAIEKAIELFKLLRARSDAMAAHGAAFDQWWRGARHPAACVCTDCVPF